MDRFPDFREEAGLRVAVEVLHVRDGHAGGGEPSVLAGDGDGLQALPGLDGDDEPLPGRLDVHDPEEGAGRVERLFGQVRGPGAVLHGQADGLQGPAAPHGRDQAAPGDGVDLELGAALGVDDQLEERYDGLSLGIFGW